jgi:hypothetical protein
MSTMKTVPPPHCGTCDPNGRWVEQDDGRVARCPRCHPSRIPAQRSPETVLPPAVNEGWMRECRRAIEYLAEQPVPFTADDVAELAIGEPDHPNHWGVVFRQASRDGVIRQVGFKQSAQESRNGGVLRMWTGTTTRTVEGPAAAVRALQPVLWT